MSRRGVRSQYEDEAPRQQQGARANFASIKAFCQIARRAFSEDEIQTIASMLADTRDVRGAPAQRQYDERDVRASRNDRNDRDDRRERGGRGGRNDDRAPVRAERGGRSEGGRGGRSEGGRGGRSEGGRGRTEGGRSDDAPRRRNNRRPEQ